MTSFDDVLVQEAAVDADMLHVLETMLENDETITARAVARNHPRLKQASSITRSDSRSRLLAKFQDEQRRLRTWSAKAPKRSREQLAAQLAQKDSRIAELERQVDILRVSHIAMMRSVGELGGTSKLLKLYEGYREFRGELQRLGLLRTGEVKAFEAAKAMKAAD
jgi:hypothetical protein